MDFHAFPSEVQHNIIRRLNIRGFFKTAITSKGMLQFLTSCWGKYWNVEVLEQWTGTTYVVSIDRQNYYQLLTLQIFKLLFHNATVRTLSPQFLLPDDIHLRCERLEIVQPGPHRFLEWERHKPNGKYETVIFSSHPTLMSPELIEWLNESTRGLEAQIRDVNLQLKVPKMSLEIIRDGAPPVAVYARRVTEEWLKGERAVILIVVTNHGHETEGDAGSFFDRYPKFDRDLGWTLYRIKRHDGEMLFVALHSKTAGIGTGDEIQQMPEFLIDTDDDAPAVKEFLSCRY